MPSDSLRMLEDLRRERIPLLRHVARLFEQRQVDVRFDVALGAGVAVPVPGPAEISRPFDDPQVGDAGLPKPNRRQLTTEAAPDHYDVELFVHRRTSESRLYVRIDVVVVRELALRLEVLRVAVRPHPLRPLLVVLPTDGRRVEAQLVGSRNRALLRTSRVFLHLALSLLRGTRDSTTFSWSPLIRTGRCHSRTPPRARPDLGDPKGPGR